MNSVTLKRRYPRYMRKRQILQIVSYWGKGGISMSAIAFWLGTRPSNHLMRILHELEEDQMLSHTTSYWRPNSPSFSWKITSVGDFVLKWVANDYGLVKV